MSVGNQPTQASINNSLSSFALQLRGLLSQIKDFEQYVTSLGTNGLEGVGFVAADAATVQTMASYLNTIAGCYFGTVQQGGSGGTGAILFNFDNALTPLWGGQ